MTVPFGYLLWGLSCSCEVRQWLKLQVPKAGVTTKCLSRFLYSCTANSKHSWQLHSIKSQKKNTERVNIEPFLLRRGADLKSQSFLSTNQYTTLFYVCLYWKTLYLLYIDAILTQNSQSISLYPTIEQSLSEAIVFNCGHITSFQSSRTPALR